MLLRYTQRRRRYKVAWLATRPQMRSIEFWSIIKLIFSLKRPNIIRITRRHRIEKSLKGAGKETGFCFIFTYQTLQFTCKADRLNGIKSWAVYLFDAANLNIDPHTICDWVKIKSFGIDSIFDVQRETDATHPKPTGELLQVDRENAKDRNFLMWLCKTKFVICHLL